MTETKANRQESIWYPMRQFHNDIKRKMISSLKSKRVFDVACGRGGDIHKYKQSGIKEGILIDPDTVAIEEAKNRNRGDSRFKFVVDSIGMTDKNYGNDFDLVTLFFAIHYLGDTLEKAIENISKSLVSGGYFIGTTIVDFTELKHPNAKIHKIDDKTYSFELNEPNDTGLYFTKPSVEYFVELEVLKTICLKYGLRFIGLKGFKEFYIKKYNLTDIQKKVSFMNSIFVFRKN